MRLLISLPLFLLLCLNTNAQDNKNLIYNPSADARQQIQSAIHLANRENKNVLIQVGGNWCPWCIRLHDFISRHAQIDSLIKADYIYILVNYSQENRNMEIMSELGYPQRFGFPVLVILNSKGDRIHTQNTAYLEEGKTYNEKKVREFLSNWNVRAIDPMNYNPN